MCALRTQICIELDTKRKKSFKFGLFGRKLSKGEIPETVKEVLLDRKLSFSVWPVNT